MSGIAIPTQIRETQTDLLQFQELIYRWVTVDGEGGTVITILVDGDAGEIRLTMIADPGRIVFVQQLGEA